MDGLYSGENGSARYTVLDLSQEQTPMDSI